MLVGLVGEHTLVQVDDFLGTRTVTAKGQCVESAEDFLVLSD